MIKALPHLVIDARFLKPESSGNGRLTFDLLACLLPLLGDYQVTVLIPPGQEKALTPYLQPNQTAEVAPEPWYSRAEQTDFRRRILKLQPDLVHFLHFNHPLGLKVPFIVTIPDLVLDEYPTPASSFLKRFLYHRVMADAVRRSQKIIAVSEATEADLLAYYRADPAKITVIYESSQSLREPPMPTAKPKLPKELTEAGVAEPYFLYVGQQRIHKNVDGLIEGFASFREQYPSGSIYRLVLAGKIDSKATWIDQALERTGLTESEVIRPGFVSEAALQALYLNATAFIFPSFKEGFGLPPLEAMRYGLPVISSNASCLPEVLGEAALYFDPTHPEELAVHLTRLVEDEALAAKLSQLGKQQQAGYCWEKAAKQTANLYVEYFKKHKKGSP